MTKISDLSDDLLVKILSYLPTKDAASTMVLSKQWQFVWMLLPNLDFDSPFTYDPDSDSDLESDVESDRKSYFERLRRFLLRNLPLYKAPVIESFRLSLNSSDIKPEVVKLCVQFAISRDVRDLDISYYSNHGKDILPSSLYTCKFLQNLDLFKGIMDVPRMVCLPSLKTLRLQGVTYENKDSLPLLLSNCPVLEDLSLSLFGFGDGGKLIVRVPSLQRLWIEIINDLDEFVIDTPSLKFLNLESDDCEHLSTSIKNMPMLKEAFLSVSSTLFGKLIRSIPSVKRLTLSQSFDIISEVVFNVFVFNNLKNLKLHILEGYSSYVLVQLLKASPNLRVLELCTFQGHGDYMEYWNQPSSVPECILSSLETFEWSGYQGRVDERELAIYILQNAPRLKTATFCLYKYKALDNPLEIIKKLEFSYRASTACQLLYEC